MLTPSTLLLLQELNVCESILQRQHGYQWLSLISIKERSRGGCDSREGANEGARAGRGGEGREKDRWSYGDEVEQAECCHLVKVKSETHTHAHTHTATATIAEHCPV